MRTEPHLETTERTRNQSPAFNRLHLLLITLSAYLTVICKAIASLGASSPLQQNDVLSVLAMLIIEVLFWAQHNFVASIGIKAQLRSMFYARKIRLKIPLSILATFTI